MVADEPVYRLLDSRRLVAPDKAQRFRAPDRCESSAYAPRQRAPFCGQVHALYFGILIADLQKQAAEKMIAYAEENLRESEEEVRNGGALKVASIQGRVDVLESQQQVLNAVFQLAGLTMELNELLGLPLDTRLELDHCRTRQPSRSYPLEEYVKTAWAENPEILAAEQAVEGARAGVAVAKTAYLPDVTLHGARARAIRTVCLFLVRNFGTFGVFLSWEVFDFGKRRADVREREAELAQATENVRRLSTSPLIF